MRGDSAARPRTPPKAIRNDLASCERRAPYGGAVLARRQWRGLRCRRRRFTYTGKRGLRTASSPELLAVGDVSDGRRLFQHARLSAVDRVRSCGIARADRDGRAHRRDAWLRTAGLLARGRGVAAWAWVDLDARTP